MLCNVLCCVYMWKEIEYYKTNNKKKTFPFKMKIRRKLLYRYIQTYVLCYDGFRLNIFSIGRDKSKFAINGNDTIHLIILIYILCNSIKAAKSIY